jgi:hypothetical protein
MAEKTGKLRDIKDTATSAVEIMKQIGDPEVRESFIKILDTAKDLMESLKTPEMVKNIENFRLISDNMKESSTKMENTMKGLKETGILDEVKGLFKSFSGGEGGGINGQDLHEVSISITEMFRSFRGLADELKKTVESSKKSGTIRDIKETAAGISDVYKTVRYDYTKR